MMKSLARWAVVAALLVSGCDDDEPRVNPVDAGADAPVGDGPVAGDGGLPATDSQMGDGGLGDGGVIPPAVGEGTIGIAGGTIMSSDGRLTLVIPRGALAGPIDFSIQPAAGPGAGEIGPAVFNVSPDRRFDVAVTVIWKPLPGDLGVLQVGDVRIGSFAGASWEELADRQANPTAGTVRGTTTHLSLFALIGGTCQACATTCNPATCRVAVDPDVPGSGVAGKCLPYGRDNTCSKCVPMCDGDGDGYCMGDPAGGEPGGDCDETNAGRSPGEIEICGNGIDDNCDGAVDEDCQACTKDADCPGAGQACIQGRCSACSNDCEAATCRVGEDPEVPGSGVAGHCVAFGQQCNTCTAMCDLDGDGFCMGPDQELIQGGDCDETKREINPEATEICGNGIDDNCDGAIDERCTVCADDAACPGKRCLLGVCQGCPAACNPATCRVAVDPDVAGSGVPGKCLMQGACSVCVPQCDMDGDGYCPGDPAGEEPGGDCDDADRDTAPDVVEICGNQHDDNCDGTADEECELCSRDADCPDAGQACTGGFCRACDTTCDPQECVFDADPAVPGSGVMGKCAPHGTGCMRCVRMCDNDGDGFCPAGPGVEAAEADCNDMNAAANPEGIEICGNGMDEDCSGAPDDGCTSCQTSAMCGAMSSCSSGK